MFVGCGAMNGLRPEPEPYKKWVEEHHIPYKTTLVPSLEWSKIARMLKADPEKPCFFSPPNNIFFRDGEYIYDGMSYGGGSMYFSQTYKEFCSDHEFCHIKEFYLRVPYHSICKIP